MALINFDCPECGHNLEVDEGGAGFIVKCPECGNPLQIPDLPPSRRRRKIAIAVATLLAIGALLAINLFLWFRARDLASQVADLEPLHQALQRAQAISIDQENEIDGLKKERSARKLPDVAALGQAALAALAEADALSGELESATRRLLEISAAERTSLLRADMRKRVEAAKNSLPAAPKITDVDPGQGVQGRQILFPVLPGPDGQKLRENAEVTQVDGEKVFFKFPGGTASYALSELHPGVAAFLPMDPLLALPRNQWTDEAKRLHQMESAQRDERLAQLRADLEAQLPPETK